MPLPLPSLAGIHEGLPVTCAQVCVWLLGAKVLGLPVTSDHDGQRRT